MSCRNSDFVSALFPEFVYPDVRCGLSSCSAAEALERPGPFVNPTLVNHALALLARMFRYGKISYRGAFVGQEVSLIRELTGRGSGH